MPSYDPQRSRSRHRAADDEGPAPVDALLGPLPDVEAAEPAAPAEPAEPAAPPEPAATDEPVRREPLIIDLDQPQPVTVPRHRGRLVLAAMALVSLVVQVLVFLWWRRRRAAETVDG
jgi:hypothetical protein